MRFNPDEYVSVHERIRLFYESFSEGRILTSLIQHDEATGFVLMKAEVYRKPEDTLPAATGHASEVKGGNGANQTSHIENAETSAVGRALAMLGFEVKKGIASREEMEKTGRQPLQAVAPARNHDREIMTALEISGKSEEELNSYVKKKFKVNQDWSDLPPARKDDLLLMLNNKINNAAAGA